MNSKPVGMCWAMTRGGATLGHWRRTTSKAWTPPVEEPTIDPDPNPFYCLLEDDSLVTKVSVESEQLLRPARPDEVVAIISVHVKKTVLSRANMSL